VLQNTSISDSPKVALVTDAGRGLGRSIARTLTRSGAKVALVGHAARGLEDTLALVGEQGRVYRTDLTRAHEVEQLLERVRTQQGSPDILVNCVPISGEGIAPWDANVELWWDAVRINLRGAFLAARGVLPGMLERGSGVIVNVCAFSKHNSSALLTSSGAIQGLTTAFATQTKSRGVRVYSVSADFGALGTPRAQLAQALAERVNALCCGVEPSGSHHTVTYPTSFETLSGALPVNFKDKFARLETEVRMH
jgi:NAD(P)-dependent dehydrogenase (short-subunit alcohol dehydrogenase family)